jgi:hypothetical protein
MVVEKTRRAGLNWQRLGLRVAGAGLLAVTGAIHLDGDVAPGQAHGNNLNLNGGLWHEVTVSG